MLAAVEMLECSVKRSVRFCILITPLQTRENRGAPQTPALTAHEGLRPFEFSFQVEAAEVVIDRLTTVFIVPNWSQLPARLLIRSLVCSNRFVNTIRFLDENVTA